jgi:hypothetical protein
MRLPPTVMRVQFGSGFCGRIRHTYRGYVARQPLGILDLCMNVMVSVPLMYRMPWANRPNSLAHECSHTSFVARSPIK